MMTIDKLKESFGKWFREHGATLLSWGATAGTVGGAVLAAKATTKAQECIDFAIAKKIDDAVNDAMKQGASQEETEEVIANTRLTLWEKIKAGGPAFIPTIAVEAATIGCIHGSNVLNKKEIAYGKDALAVAVAGIAAYKESVGQLTDRTTEFAAAKRVEMMEEAKQNGDPPWDDKQLFQIDGRDDVFESTMEQVFEVEYEANRTFTLKGELTLNELYEMFGLPKVTDELVYENDGDCMGWEEYIGEVYYGYHWIDFGHKRIPLPDGRMVTRIYLPFGPHPMDEEFVDEMFAKQDRR